MTKDYGHLISEYSVDYKKFILNKIAFFAGIPLFALLLLWYSNGNQIFLNLTPITALFTLATFIAYRFYKPASLKAYQNGIEVDGWGFSPWGSINIQTEPDTIILFWNITKEEFSQKLPPNGASGCAHSEDHNCAVIIFNAARFCTNISAYNFYESIKDYLSGPTLPPQPVHKTPSALKTIVTNILFGNENPDLKHIIKCSLFYVFFIIIFSYLISEGFVLPSSIWGASPDY